LSDGRISGLNNLKQAPQKIILGPGKIGGRKMADFVQNWPKNLPLQFTRGIASVMQFFLFIFKKKIQQIRVSV
jgi:hypothetical protein